MCYKNKKSPCGDILGEKQVRQIWGTALLRIPPGGFQGMIRQDSELRQPMKSNKKEWIFYLVVGCGVLLNEIASNFGLQMITFTLTILAAIWAGSKFLTRDESVN